MVSNGFIRLEANHCCYFKWIENSYIMLLLYVDDMLVAGSNMNEIVNLNARLAEEFLMKYLGPVKKILEIRTSK